MVIQEVYSDNLEEKEKMISPFFGLNEDVNNTIDSIVKNSRFQKLVGQKFINKKGEKLICNLYDNCNGFKKICLINDEGKIVSEIIFSYEKGFFYIDKVQSIEEGNGGLILDIFLNELGNKGIFLEDAAYSIGDGNIRLDQFYIKRGFRISKHEVGNINNILFRGGINIGEEARILNKYF